jgi:putative MATE family efflux protein
MTEGNILKKMMFFALPVLLGNLFQQLYNTVDALVVGNVLGKEALAAVTSSGSLIFLIIGLVQGIFVGAGVVVARFYGAKDMDVVHTAVHTTIAFALAAGAGLTVLGIALTPTLLTWMGTPEDVFPSSVLYFRFYFAGAMGIALYNACAGIFQAVGDSRSPLRFLIFSSVTNVVLDLLFVAVLRIGIAGAALATMVSQLLSASLAFRKLTRADGPHRVRVRHIRFDGKMLRRIVGLGLPTGVQNSVISFANVIVQSNINAFGSDAMAGSGTYFKLEGFAFLPITSFCVAITTFVSQNLGAGLHDRARKGARFGVAAAVLAAEAVGLTLIIFAPHLVGLFTSEPAVIAGGVTQIRTEAWFFCLLALSHSMAAVLRGAGKAKIPMLVMLLCWCAIRITYITITVHFIPDIRVVFWAYPLTWSLSSIIFLIYYNKADWVHGFGA